MAKARTKTSEPKVKTANKARISKTCKTKIVAGLPAAPAMGRPIEYQPKFADIARSMAKLGGTDYEIAEELGISTSTLWRWRSKYQDFSSALIEGKDAFDDRVERSLAQKAVGYTFHTEKIMQFEGQVIRANIVEHVAPDVGAIKLWLGNRRPDKWREQTTVNLTGAEAFVNLWKAISAGTLTAGA